MQLEEFEMTMEDYLLGAKKIMIAQRYGDLTRDDEAVGEVASRMMMADHTWNGRSKRDTWRYNNATYAISKIVKKRKRQKRLVSLSNKLSDYDGMTFGDIIPDKSVEYGYTFEVVDKVLDGKMRDCVNMKYRDNMTLQEIGDHMGFTRERARQYINEGIQKLRKCM